MILITNSKRVMIIRFETGDEIDKLVVQVIVHEFSRCMVSFNSFISHSPKSEEELKKTSDFQNIIRYNTYASFVQHLYEYFVGCLKRDKQNTKEIHSHEIDTLINKEVNKILNIWRTMIDAGIAPSWANDRSHYEDTCPEDFGKDFRAIRNSISHADYRRLHGGTRITLAEFFRKYHKYAMLLYNNGREWWSLEHFDDIHLGEITSFNQLIFKEQEPI